MTADPVREAAIANFRKKFFEHRDLENRLKKSKFSYLKILNRTSILGLILILMSILMLILIVVLL
jgi:hypothetical protein